MEPALLKLEVYRLAHELGLHVHRMTLGLPSIERFEEASQIRRCSKRVSASIVEGHSQRKHKGLYLSYLYRALGSADEAQEHLLYLRETGSLSDATVFNSLMPAYESLSRKLFRFIQVIERKYQSPHYLEDVFPESSEPDSDDEGSST